MELENAKTIFPQVRQIANEWCIPAGLEVLLHYFGIPKPSQTEMVLRYAEQFGDKGYFINRQLVAFRNKPTVDELKLCGFPHGNFDSFSAIANSLLPADCNRYFYHPNDCETEFEKYLSGSLKNGDGILGVIRLNNGNCHVLPIIGYDGSAVTVYDPGPGTVETKALCDFTFNRDCVILKIK